MSGDGPRMPCAVLGCAATRGLHKADRGVMPAAWICSACWDEVPDPLGAEYRRLQRLERREADCHGAPSPALAERADIFFAQCAAAAGRAIRCEAP